MVGHWRTRAKAAKVKGRSPKTLSLTPVLPLLNRGDLVCREKSLRSCPWWAERDLTFYVSLMLGE